MTIIVRRPWARQPQRAVAIDHAVWPGRTMTMLPSLWRAGVIGEAGNFSAANANGAIFSNVGLAGLSLGYRVNSSTAPGECFTWTTGEYDAGPDTSAIAVLAQTDFSYPAQILYGGASAWGLMFAMGYSSAVAKYVDNPTSASYSTTMTGLSQIVGRFYVIGAVKKGNTISLFFKGQKTSTTGGNGGLRRAAGSGFGNDIIDGSYGYGKAALISMTSSVLSDGAMFRLLENPWKIFAPRRIIIPTAIASTLPTLSAPSYTSITTVGATPRVNYAY